MTYAMQCLDPEEVEEFLSRYHETPYRYRTRGLAGGTQARATVEDILAYHGRRFADGAYADTRLPSERRGDEVMCAACAGEDVADAVMQEHWAQLKALKKWSAAAIATIVERDHADELKQAEASIRSREPLTGAVLQAVRMAAKYGNANAAYLYGRHLSLRSRARLHKRRKK